MSIPPWLQLFDSIYSAIHSALVIFAIVILWKATRLNAEAIALIHTVLNPMARTRLFEAQAKKNKKK